MPPFLMVVGCQRSGTTLLKAMLDAHPGVAVPGESHFIAPMSRIARRYQRFGGFNEAVFHTDLGRFGRLGTWDIPDGALAKWTAGADSLPDAIRRIYAGYASVHEATRYVDKTPNYVRSISRIAALLPETRFVHIIRDPRNVALSLVSRAGWGPVSVGEATRYWAKRVRSGIAQGSTLPPSRYMQLRYEDLIADPEGELRQICGFGGISFNPVMLSFETRADRLLSEVASPEDHQNIRRPVTADLRDFRHEMTEPDQILVEQVLGPDLDALGYERMYTKVGESSSRRSSYAILLESLPRRAVALPRHVAFARNIARSRTVAGC